MKGAEELVAVLRSPIHLQETDNYRLHYVLQYHVRKYSGCAGLLNTLLQHVFQL